MDCTEIHEKLSLNEENDDLNVHLQSCASCQKYVASVQKIRFFITQDSLNAHISGNILRQIDRSLDQYSRKSQFLRVVVSAMAATAALFLISLFMIQQPQNTPTAIFTVDSTGKPLKILQPYRNEQDTTIALDDALIHVEANSRLRFDAGRSLTLTQGAILIQRINSSVPMMIHTKYGTCMQANGSSGIAVHEAKTQIYVHTGTASLKNTFGTVSLTAGKAAEITSGFAPAFISSESISQTMQWQKLIQAQAPKIVITQSTSERSPIIDIQMLPATDRPTMIPVIHAGNSYFFLKVKPQTGREQHIKIPVNAISVLSHPSTSRGTVNLTASSPYHLQCRVNIQPFFAMKPYHISVLYINGGSESNVWTGISESNSLEIQR